MLVQLDQEKDPEFREELIKRLQNINPERTAFDLSLDMFRVIADWYHFAILELTYLPDFRPEPSYLVKRLGISRLEAQTAVERLSRLELIEKGLNGETRKSRSYVMSESAVPNDALKLYHKQILQKAIEALEGQSPKERLSATDIVPLDSRSLPEIDRLSREFSSAVIKIAERAKTKDCVYALAVHAFRITQNEKEEKSK